MNTIPSVVAVEFSSGSMARTFTRVMPPTIHSTCTTIDPLRQTDKVSSHSDIEARAVFWAEYLSDQEIQPNTVLAYCTGSPFALALARHIDAKQIVLFDPVHPTTSDVQEAFTELVAGVDSNVNLNALPCLSAMTTSDGIIFARDYLTEVTKRADLGLPDGIVEQLIAKQLSWLGYTVAASKAPTIENKELDITAILSNGVCTDIPSNQRESIPVSADRLLSAPETTTILAKLLGTTA
ncbi:hypothetical protein [Streptomyces decoyicus]|uniref:hypothetical protein n=1 Tax=Streptomyces decoyicus TaxID=249567 RepID=UPI00381C9261